MRHFLHIKPVMKFRLGQLTVCQFCIGIDFIDYKLLVDLQQLKSTSFIKLAKRAAQIKKEQAAQKDENNTNISLLSNIYHFFTKKQQNL